MKPLPLLCLIAQLHALSLVGADLWSQPHDLAHPSAAAPAIVALALDATNLTVTGHVPEGFSRVTLEGRKPDTDVPWQPRAVTRVDGKGGQVEFRLSLRHNLELLRLRADVADPLPPSFYTGITSFEEPPAPTPITDTSLRSLTTGTEISFLTGTTFDTVAVTGPLAVENGPMARIVAESDIWKLHGDRIYFFNQWRGLQVIDVSVPDLPVVLGTFPLVAAGEQMFVLNDGLVILLARECSVGNVSTKALIMDAADGTPRLLASVPIPGSLVDSRLVGSSLYVVTHDLRSVSAAEPWMLQFSTGTGISSFDLSTPSAPQARTSLWLTNVYHGAVAATDSYLLVTGTRPGERMNSEVHLFDITASDGAIRALGRIPVAGNIKDKFKLHINDTVLSAVSELPDRSVVVETFSLSQPDLPAKLGTLRLVENESLFATRFEGNLLYAVTFEQVDPLWVVDLSNPAQPTIVGHLEVPGFSTYIEPLGTKLLAVGRESMPESKASVSLFDLANPASPALMSRVYLGDAASDSAALYDEKALAVYPEAGLILMPFTSYGTNGSSRGVQLIDLAESKLTMRGRVERGIEPRRAAVHKERILSLSGRELLSVDAEDRDHPLMTSGTELAWPVDRVFGVGECLVQVSGTPGSANSAVRVTPARAPDNILASLSLTNLPFVGAARRDNYLYILHGRPALRGAIPLYVVGTLGMNTNGSPGILSLTVIDMSQVPEVKVVGQVQKECDYSFGFAACLDFSPEPDVLVWRLSDHYGLQSYKSFPVFRTGYIDAYPGRVRGLVFSPAHYWLGGFQLAFQPFYSLHANQGCAYVAFDVADRAHPVIASEMQMRGTNEVHSAQAFGAGAMVFSSHTLYEPMTVTNRSVWTNLVVEPVTNRILVTNLVHVPVYSWETNVDVIVRSTNRLTLNTPPIGESWQWKPPLPCGVLSSGGSHSLMISPSGTLLSWGGNPLGQLGDGSQTGRAAIAPVLSGIRSVAAGALHSLAIEGDGSVLAWGFGFHGQLGNGAPQLPQDLPPLPYQGSQVPVNVIGLQNVTEVAAGMYHSLAVDASGRAWEWGRNWAAEADAVELQYVPAVVSELQSVRQVAAGSDHSLAVLSDGTLSAWGRNERGQLGASIGAVASRPVATALTNIIQAAAGLWFSLALDADGHVWGWGLNSDGVVGAREVGQVVSTPVRFPGLDNVICISAGRDHALALKADGTVWAWGGNRSGQLGSASVSRSTQPLCVWGVTNAVAVAAGRWFSVALTERGELWAWGQSDSGQLGDGASKELLLEQLTTNAVPVVSYTTTTNITEEQRITSVSRWRVVTNEWSIVTHKEKEFLDAVDFAIPTSPVLRPPLAMPGRIHGLSHEGALLYSKTYRPGTNSAGAYYIEACAYDGVALHWVNRTPVSGSSPVVITPQGGMFHATPHTAASPGRLELWSLASSGEFAKEWTAGTPAPLDDLAFVDGLIAVSYRGQVELYRPGAAGDVKKVGGIAPGACLQYDVNLGSGVGQQVFWLPLGAYGLKSIPLEAGTD